MITIAFALDVHRNLKYCDPLLILSGVGLTLCPRLHVRVVYGRNSFPVSRRVTAATTGQDIPTADALLWFSKRMRVMEVRSKYRAAISSCVTIKPSRSLTLSASIVRKDNISV